MLELLTMDLEDVNGKRHGVSTAAQGIYYGSFESYQNVDNAILPNLCVKDTISQISFRICDLAPHDNVGSILGLGCFFVRG